MRWRITLPWLLLGGIGAASLGGAIGGAVDSPRYVYFSTPAGGNTQAAARLAAAVRATMSLPSFTRTVHFKGNTSAEVLVYQAPNRTKQIYEPGPDVPWVTIGSNIYWKVSNVGSRWVKQPSAGGRLSAPANAMEFLRPFAQPTDVYERGDTFTSTQVLSAEDSGAPGPELLQAVTTIRDRFVIQQRLRITLAYRAETNRVVGTINYSRLGSSPPVTLPPRQDIVRAVACGVGCVTAFWTNRKLTTSSR